MTYSSDTCRTPTCSDRPTDRHSNASVDLRPPPLFPVRVKSTHSIVSGRPIYFGVLSLIPNGLPAGFWYMTLPSRSTMLMNCFGSSGGKNVTFSGWRPESVIAPWRWATRQERMRLAGREQPGKREDRGRGRMNDVVACLRKVSGRVEIARPAEETGAEGEHGSVEPNVLSRQCGSAGSTM